MGSDDLFKKRRRKRQKRKHDFKKPKANSFLIVTEGECTEPFYFKGVKSKIEAGIGGHINIVEAPRVDIYGEGAGTGKLIEITDEIIKKAKIMYQNIWLVFDKDDFKDFDQAIRKASQKGYNVAWSNQSFEYWLYLHFYYSESALHRDDWEIKLDEIFNKNNIGEGKYHKNDTDIYDLVNGTGNVDTAIKNAKRRMGAFRDNRDLPSEYDPGTMVYKLVEELIYYLSE